MMTWDQFYPDVLPDVIGCPEPLVDRALLHAAREFCDFTKVWRADLSPISTLVGTATYPLVLPTGADMVEVIDATLAGVTIPILPSMGTTLIQRQSTAGARGIQMIDSDTVQLMPIPAAAGVSLILSAILQPSDSATGLPDAIGADNRLAIATGAIARLLLGNKAPWGNPQLAGVKRDEFRDFKGTAQKKAFRAYSNRSPRARGQAY